MQGKHVSDFFGFPRRAENNAALQGVRLPVKTIHSSRIAVSCLPPRRHYMSRTLMELVRMMVQMVSMLFLCILITEPIIL